MQGVGRQPQRAPDGAPIHYERHRPEQTALYRLVQQHAASFIADTEASTGSELPRFIKDEFDAFLECGILAHGLLRLRCGECGHDKLLAFSCKRRGFCPSCGARRMSQTAAHLMDHVVPHVPVRQWVLSLPIPLRLLLAAQPELVTPVQRVLTRHLLGRSSLKAEEDHGGAVTLIQRFGSAANLNIHLHCLVLDGVYRCGADGVPAFVEVVAPTDEDLHALLQRVIFRCILQRTIFILIGLVCLITALAPWRRLRIGLNLVTVLLAGGGMIAAGYQHEVAAESFSCNITFADKLITAIGLESLWPWMFQVTASCAESAISVLGVPFEFWSLGLFALLALAAAGLMLRVVRIEAG